MPLIVWGMNHASAGLLWRERFARLHQDLPAVLQRLAVDAICHELVILSTCNRCEWYGITHHGDTLLAALADYYECSIDEFKAQAYFFEGAAAIEHLLKVSCGLDSMVLGEPQIFGQVKEAYHLASRAGVVGPHIHFLFRHLFSATKRIRHDSGIGQNPISMASSALNLAKCIFSDMHQLHIVLIGVGEMTLSALTYFHQLDAASITLANRTFSKAKAIADRFGIEAIDLSDDELISRLSRANIVISATASPFPIITHAMLKKALQVPRHRPLLLLDLAMPRDVESNAEQLDFVYLYNIDDLKQMSVEGLSKRQLSAKKAEKLIVAEVAHCMKLCSERRFTSMIRAYREQVDSIRAQEIEKAIKALAAGGDPVNILQMMARSLTNKLMHEPSVQLRHAGYHGRIDVLEAAKRILGIGEPCFSLEDGIVSELNE